MLELQLPEALQLSFAEQQALQFLNPAYEMKFTAHSILFQTTYIESNKIPFHVLQWYSAFSYNDFYALASCNTEQNRIEFKANKLWINMGVTCAIGAFAALILAALVYYNRQLKLGRVYNDPTAYELTDAEGNISHKIPDISLVRLQEHISNERGFIQVSPLLAIETVSSRYGLQHDLQKMATHWMLAGTELGLVIDPFRETYHVFEQNQETYHSFDFAHDFTHPLLPDFAINFGTLWHEIQTEA